MRTQIVSVNVASRKGERKSPIPQGRLVLGHGLEADAHAGGGRQVSLLAQESIDKGIASGVDLHPGDFGENLTTQGLDLVALGIGRRLIVGDEAILQISQIGKVCDQPCNIGRRLGDCIMPREGVFAAVLRGGGVAPGDSLAITDTKVAAVLTASDRCASGERVDESGPLLVAMLGDLGIALADYRVLPDDEPGLRAHLEFLADRCAVDLILTTGGTGFSPRDRTPEATRAVLDSHAPGISEAIRADGMRHTIHACLSRGVSGLRGRTVIINLPGSARAMAQSADLLRAVLPHLLETLRAESADCEHHDAAADTGVGG